MILRQKLAPGRATAKWRGPSAWRAHGARAATADTPTDAALEALLYPKTPSMCVRPEPAVLHPELPDPSDTRQS